MKKNISIVSDGTCHGTKVFDENNNEIKGITKIEIEPMEAKNIGSDLITAKLTLVGVHLQLKNILITSEELELKTIEIDNEG